MSSTATACEKSRQILESTYKYNPKNDDYEERRTIFDKCATDYTNIEFNIENIKNFDCSRNEQECTNYINLKKRVSDKLNNRYVNLLNSVTNPKHNLNGEEDTEGNLLTKIFNDTAQAQALKEQALKERSSWKFDKIFGTNGGRRSKRTKRNRKKRRSMRRKKHSL